jgi:UDP-N-acetylglucosamine--N-acetylmuramyl-(pentapeptide) pyrophosphoryl-undecaprenol N-acetylglucosamine transferase
MTDARASGRARQVAAAEDCFVISGAGIAGRGVAQSARAMLGLGRGIAQARSVLARIDVAAVVGFGGYASVAPVLATRLLPRRPPVLLHEQNAVLGRANRFLTSHASALALSFERTERVPGSGRIVLTGNPVREAVAALASVAYEPPHEKFNLLILGGSLGARAFSDLIPPAVAALPDRLRGRLRISQQCRAEDLDRVRANYDAAGVEAALSPFFADVAARIAAAHLVIARAGASTVAELATAGRPAIFVPLPGSIDDHQTANARALADTGGGWLEPQAKLDPARLRDRLGTLLDDPAALARAAAAARATGRPDAAARLADVVQAHLRQESQA